MDGIKCLEKDIIKAATRGGIQDPQIAATEGSGIPRTDRDAL